MCEPHRKELWIESETTTSGICNAREVLEADEGDTSPIHDQFTGIRSANTDHQYYVNVRVDLEQLGAPCFCCPSQFNDINPLKHRAEIGAIGSYCFANDVFELWTDRLDDVVVPVGFEEIAMRREVTVIRDLRL